MRPIYQAVFTILLLIFSHARAGNLPVYEWTDTWGVIQYSHTPSAGSRLSDKTEIPDTTELSETDKQRLQIQKLKEIRAQGQAHIQQADNEQYRRQYAIDNERYCRKLRDMLSYQQLQRSSYRYSDRYPDRYYRLPNTSSILLENELRLEIRNSCR